MRQSVAALALIRRRDPSGRLLWLTQWNDRWNAYAFVGGHKRPSETFRTCVIREVEEELYMHLGADFTVAEEPFAHLEYSA